MSSDSHIVAVDGPSASGKSTVSRQVADALKYTYVDSGAFYRGITWKAVREQVDVKDAEAVVDMIRRMDFQVFVRDGVVAFTIDGVDPDQELRSEPVREKVSDIAAIPEVRFFVVRQLQDTARFGDIVMEGRDIGSVVFPAARFKFYLDADPEERARRRHQEIETMEGKSDVQDVLHSLQRRDKKDTMRKTAPLQIALGAEVINSTSMSIEEVVQHIVGTIRTSDVTS